MNISRADRSEAPPRRPFHPLAKVAAGAALLGLGINGGLGVLDLIGSELYHPLVFYNILIAGMLLIATLGPGLEAFLRWRWPGDTVIARASRPRAGDLLLVALAFAAAAANIALVLLHLERSRGADFWLRSFG